MSSTENEKKDFFGRRYKEKFPNYPHGVIIPRCKPIKGGKSACTSRPSSMGASTCASLTRRVRKCLKNEEPCSTSTKMNIGRPVEKKSRQEQTKQSSKIDTTAMCKQVADIVAQEVPCSKIDQEFLEELQLKCKRYWDLLLENSIHLDENAVYEELTSKLRTWVRENHEALESSNCETTRRSEEEGGETFADDYTEEFEEDFEDEEYEYVTRLHAEFTESESHLFDE